MGGYLVPVADEADLWVSASWQDHRDRTPPSGEPGTDYACSTNTPVRAPGPGRVVDVKTSNSGAMGRYVAVRLDDGRDTRTLHMARVDARVGDRVGRGEQLGLSGASGNGSDYYYGPHAHQTLWPGEMWDRPTIDFEKYTGAGGQPAPPADEREDDMPRNTGVAMRRAADNVWVYLLFNYGSGIGHQFNSGSTNPLPGGTTNALAAAFDTPSWAEVSESHFNAILRSLEDIQHVAIALDAAP